MPCCGGIARTQCSALLATLCRFDHIYRPKANTGPFIPWERRLAQTGFMEIQGRDLLMLFLKQGLWQASLTYFGDTPDYGLTLRYIPWNLAIWRPLGECEEPGVRRPQQGAGVPGGRRYGPQLLVGPWQYQSEAKYGYPVGGWVVPGIAPTGTHPACTTPGTPTSPPTCPTPLMPRPLAP